MQSSGCAEQDLLFGDQDRLFVFRSMLNHGLGSRDVGRFVYTIGRGAEWH
jgi:hypothetical protein